MRSQTSILNTCIFLKRLFIIFSSLFIFCFASISKADVGADWLSQQVSVDGSYVDNIPLATNFQSSSEAVNTLQKLGVISLPDLQTTLSYLNADTQENTENLSRIIIISSLVGVDASLTMAKLLKHQNSDGGFGDFEAHQSTALDTAFALEAIEVSGTPVSQIVANTVGYLLNTQNPDGGFSLSETNEGSVYVTSLASRALQHYIFQYNVSNEISLANEYLLTNQMVAGGWATDWETALALLSIAPVVTDATRYADAITQLTAHQNINGSWGGSVYTTALALQAFDSIKNIKQPVDLKAGIFTGEVVDALTNAPLQGVQVSIQGVENYLFETASDGRFTASNLSAPDTYTITYNAVGYLGASQSVSIGEGQQIYLGVVKLNSLPDTGFIAGSVSDSLTGEAIGNATVTVTNNTNVFTVNTETDGSYFIAVKPGNVTITVSASGYTTVSATGTVLLGNTVSFSPALTLEGSSSPGLTSTLSGTVIDQDSLLPIDGVNVSMTGVSSNSVVSGVNGNFEFSGVSVGEAQLTFTKQGYQTSSMSLVVSSGVDASLGNIQMRKQTGVETTLSGTVIDNSTGESIAGAIISVMGNSTTSAADGSFVLEGVTALDFKVSASATGYLTFESQLVLQESGRIQINIPMEKAVVGGFEIVSLSASQQSYQAYDEVVVTSLLSNSKDLSQVVRLYVAVYDANGVLIDQFPAVETDDLHGTGHNHTVSEPFVTVDPGMLVSAPASWHTDSNLPGQYRMVIQAYEAFDGILLSEKEIFIDIEETRELETLIVSSEPNYSTQGSTELVSFLAQVIHKSNVEFNIDFTFNFLSPAGQVVFSGTKTIALDPKVTNQNVPLGDFQYLFDEPGEYRVTIDSVIGAVPLIQQGRSLYVAPGTRVEVEQGLSPSVLVPDGDKQIGIQIRLKGAAQ